MANILAKLMKEREVTQYKLSKDTGFSQSTISCWVNNTSTISAERAAVLADYFGVSIDEFMNREQQKKPAAKSNGAVIGPAYLSLAKDMQDKGIHPNDVRKIMDILERRKND